MSDLLSLLGSSSNKSQSELLVESYKQTQKTKVDALNTRKKSLETKQSFYSSLRSKVNSVVSQLDIFNASDIFDKFKDKKTNLSDASFFTASADGTALIGTTSAKVNRIALNDALISKQLTLGGTTFNDLSGDQTITFNINGVAENITVNFTGSETNKEAMTKIVNAVNNFAYDSDGDGETDDAPPLSATLVQDTTTTGRISFTSKDTGADYNIQFSDSPLLEKLGITTASLNPNTNTRTVSTGTDAGYQKSDMNMLNSEIELGGIKVTRNSNEIKDALTGITLNLLKAQEVTDAAVTINTDVDTDGIVSLIQPLLTAYNDLINFVSNDRSMLRSDSAISNLKFNLRTIASEPVSGLQSGNPTRLTDMGIKIQSNGTLTVNDKDALQKILKDDPQKVADIFSSEDGFVAKINDAIANLTGNNNLITSRTLSLSKQIDETVQKKTQLEDRIDRQANILRKQYESMLKIMLEAQSQYSLISNY